MPLAKPTLLTPAQLAANSRQPLVKSSVESGPEKLPDLPMGLNPSPRRLAKPSKPNTINALGINRMSMKFLKQTDDIIHHINSLQGFYGGN